MEEAPLQMENTDVNIDELVKFEETQPNKRRRKKSIVWEHFTVESVGDGCTRAVCKQCKQTFSYSNGTKVAGTSHLKRHIALGVCPVIRRREKNQLAQYNATSPSAAGTPGISTDPPQRRYRGTPFIANIPFDQDRCRQQIAEMIIMHDYPLHMVEHSAFVSFVQNLQPHFNMGNFNTIEGDCIEIYSREKQHLAKLLTEIPGQISLALDLWISSQSVGYVFLMGYFIDNFWKLHRRVLNVVLVPSPYSEDALSHAIGFCLHDWGLDKKLCTITLDKGIWNDSGTEFLRGFLSIKNPKILDGQFLIEHCYAHVLRSIALDGLEAMRDLINKVRESIKYVKTSQANEEKFFELKQQLQVPSMKSLFLDDQTQWNTTYLMLSAAMELKEVFSCLDTTDADYKLAPTMDDWKQIEILCSYLKLLYDAASLLLDISTTTANLYFHEVWKIQLEFTHAAMSEDQFVRCLTNPLKEKFDRYWKDCNLVLATTVVVDPRFKMKLVEFSFSKIYGDDASTYIKTVDDGIRELFSEYSAQPLMLTSGYVEVEHNAEDVVKTDLPQVSGTTASDRLSDFDVFISEMSTTQPMKSELDQYLEEALLARVQDFDILSWWKLNQIKFPTLSRMARDLLSIPVSTVSPDTVFKTESNKLDQYRSSLRPETLEALVCAKDWHQKDWHQSSLSTSYEVSTSNAIVKMEY